MSLTSLPPGTLPESSWQATLRARMEAQQEADQAHAGMIAQYKKLATALKESRERNAAWLRSRDDPAALGGSVTQGEAPSRQYISTLEHQLSNLRTELSTLYRTTALTSSKFLSLTDSLRDRDSTILSLTSQLASLTTARDKLLRREKEWEERYRMRDADVQGLHDEVLGLTLELNQVEGRNKALREDNASLLQRWLDRMNERAERMNEDFEQEGRGGNGTTNNVGDAAGAGTKGKERVANADKDDSATPVNGRK